jgi:hypothetical protein
LLEANMCVTNGIPLKCLPHFLVDVVNCVATLKETLDPEAICMTLSRMFAREMVYAQGDPSGFVVRHTRCTMDSVQQNVCPRDGVCAGFP